MKKFLFFFLGLFLTQLIYSDNPYQEFQLENAGLNPTPLDLKFDKQGNCILLYVTYDGTSSLKFAYKPAGQETFNDPVLIMKDSGANGLSASITFDNDGNAIVLWTKLFIDSTSIGNLPITHLRGIAMTQTTMSNRVFSIYYAYRPAGSATKFSTPSVVNNFRQNLNPRPKITFDKQNNAILVMNDFEYSSTYYTERPAGSNSTFNPTKHFLPLTGYQINSSDNLFQKLISDSNGNIILAWNTEENGLRYAIRKNGTNNLFSSIKTIQNTSNTHTSYVDLAADTKGNTFAVWGNLIPFELENSDQKEDFQFSVKPAKKNNFGSGIESDLGTREATEVNVVYNISVAPNGTSYLSMMNALITLPLSDNIFDGVNLDNLNYVFKPQYSYRLASETTFRRAQLVFKKNPDKTVAIPFLKLSKIGTGVIASYMIDLTQAEDGDDSPLVKASLAVAQKGANSNTFVDNGLSIPIDYFQDGPNGLSFSFDVDPQNNYFFAVYNQKIPGTETVKLLYRNLPVFAD